MANKRRRKLPALLTNKAPLPKGSGTTVTANAKVMAPPPIRLSRSRDLVLAILGVLVGVGIAMIPLNFWVGVAISTLAAILFVTALYLLVENTTGRWTGIAIAVVCYSVVIWAVFVPASIITSIGSRAGNYPSGSDVYGVKW